MRIFSLRGLHWAWAWYIWQHEPVRFAWSVGHFFIFFPCLVTMLLQVLFANVNLPYIKGGGATISPHYPVFGILVPPWCHCSRCLLFLLFQPKELVDIVAFTIQDVPLLKANMFWALIYSQLFGSFYALLGTSYCLPSVPLARRGQQNLEAWCITGRSGFIESGLCGKLGTNH